VFLDYAHNGAPERSFAANQDVLTFTLSGVSKISALPQMKVAWIATSGPAEEVEAAQARLEVISDTYLSMNAPIQWAVPALLEQRKSIPATIARSGAGESRRARPPALPDKRRASAWLWKADGTRSCAFRSRRLTEELAVDLLRRKSVLVHPGHFYDFPKRWISGVEF